MPVAHKRLQRKVVIGRDAQGRQIRKSIYGYSKKELDEKEIQLKLEIAQGQDINAKKKFKYYREGWLEEFASYSSEQSAKRVGYVCRKLEQFDDWNVKDIKHKDIMDFFIALAKCNPKTGKPMSQKALRDLRNYFRKILDYAERNGAIVRNPINADFQLPSGAPPKERQPITDEQMHWIVETPHRCQFVAMVMLFTGVRPEEAAALTWDDINFEEKYISINKAAISFEGDRGVKDFTKTPAGMRTVYPPKILLEYLRKEYASGERNKTFIAFNTDVPISKWQFDNLWDTYMTAFEVKYGVHVREVKSRYQLKGVMKTAPTFTRYQLRHTFATMMDTANVDLLTRPRVMGHNDLEMTMHYTHRPTFSEVDRVNMEAIDSIFEEKLN